tara:strand:- start:3752 stop:4762 length:1011 start_codon:yes stop_codon:yes gene_type:complete
MPDDLPDKKLLEKIFREIRQGYSSFTYREETCFVKHASYDQTDILNESYDEYYNKASSKGVMNEKELLETLEEQGVWSPEDENLFEKKEVEMENLKRTSANLIVKAQRESFEKRIKQLEKTLSKHREKRNSLVKNTAEEYASKRSNEIFMFYSLFKDKDFKEMFFSQEDFDHLNKIELSEVYIEYNKSIEIFSQENIRQLSIESLFTSLFNLFDKDVSNFYGKNVFDLSYYQINLLNYGKLFVKIFENKEIPKGIQRDAGKILEYLEESETKSKAAKTASEKAQSAAGFSYKGATREDLEEAGINTKGAMDIHELADKEGKDGELDMEDLMKIHKK